MSNYRSGVIHIDAEGNVTYRDLEGMQWRENEQ